MWGTHLFEAAEQMADRRSFRTARRRLDRRQQRVRLLQESFADEINKIDSKFMYALRRALCGKKIKPNRVTNLQFSIRSLLTDSTIMMNIQQFIT